MLTAMREVKREGLTKEQSMQHLKNSGVVDKNGKVTEPYKKILKVK